MTLYSRGKHQEIFVCLVQLTTAAPVGITNLFGPSEPQQEKSLFYQIPTPLEPLQKKRENSWQPIRCPPAYSASPCKPRQQWTQNTVITGRLSEIWTRKHKSCPRTEVDLPTCTVPAILKFSITISEWDLNMLLLTIGGTFLRRLWFLWDKSLQFIKSI